MERPPSAADTPQVDPISIIELIVQLEQTDPIKGRIGCSPETSRAFTGWVALMTELDQLLLAGPNPRHSRGYGKSKDSNPA